MFCKSIRPLVAHKGHENSDQSGVRTLSITADKHFLKMLGVKSFTNSCACRTAGKGFLLYHPSQLDGKQKIQNPFLTDPLHYKFRLILTFFLKPQFVFILRCTVA